MTITCVNCGLDDSGEDFFSLPIYLERDSGDYYRTINRESLYGCPRCGTVFMHIMGQSEYYPNLKKNKEELTDD